MGNEKEVEIGDFVFAKVRGYPAWPARIVAVLDPRPATLKYRVFFFGTSETATVQAKEVFPYVTNKDKFGKPMKRKFFNEGIEELEEEMKKVANGEKSTKGFKDDEAATPVRAPIADSEEKDTEVKGVKRNRESHSEDAIGAKRRRKSSAPAPPDTTNDKQNTDSPEDKEKKSTEGEGAGKKRKKSNVSDSADTSQSKEQISRSGRVIKPKKFLYDEEGKEEVDQTKQKPKAAETPEPTKETPSKEESTPKRVSKEKPKKAKVVKDKEAAVKEEEKESSVEKTDDTVVEVTPPKLAAMGRVIWARSKCGQLVQVKVDHDRPAAFKDEKSRVQWEKGYEQHLKKVKKRIETGEALPDDVHVQLMPTPDRLPTMTEEQINLCKKLRLVERKKGKMRWLKLETRLVDIDMLLRISLQKTKVNVEKALQLLDELINLPLDPLMLKKHPQLVETVRKLRQYTGNIQNWNMSSEEEATFKKNAAKIRQKANTLLNRFRGLFAVSKPEDFMNIFLNSVNEFKNLTKDLPASRVYSLIIDPSSPYYKEISEFDNEDEEFGREILKNASLADKTIEDES